MWAMGGMINANEDRGVPGDLILEHCDWSRESQQLGLPQRSRRGRGRFCKQTKVVLLLCAVK